MHVWLAEASARQRTLLVSRYDPSASTGNDEIVLAFAVADGRCTLTMLRARDLEWSQHVRLTSQRSPLHGLLGLLNVQKDTFLVAVSSADRVGAVSEHQTVWRVHGVAFLCLNRAHTDAFDTPNLGTRSASEEACDAMQKYLTSGNFYFAERGAFDLTQRFQSKTEERTLRFDSMYAWNAYMMEPLLQYRTRLDATARAELDKASMFLLTIHGFVGTQPVSYGTGTATLAVISRLSARRAGTRFNARGIDDQGNAANFAETETVLVCGDLVYSYVQLRGSVPIYWEQQGLQALNARIQITRSDAAVQPAFNKHLEQLLEEFGHVFVLDLLGTRDAETQLSSAYVRFVDKLRVQHPELRYYNFDLHAIAKSAGGLDGARAELGRLNNVQKQQQVDMYTLLDLRKKRSVYQQFGVFRVNCFDCLDRTNVVQGCLSQTALRNFLVRCDARDPALEQLQQAPAQHDALWRAHGHLWAENGDALSQISTGTGSLNSGFTRGAKKSFAGLLSDAAKSASRMYMNNFQDRAKQQAIDTLVGGRADEAPVQLYDPFYEQVDVAMAARKHEYTSPKPMRMFLTTYNANARTPGSSLDAWLAPAQDAEFVCVVLQEIVPLSAQGMLSSATEPLQVWVSAVLDALNARVQDAFVVLRHELLFATAVLLFTRQSLLPDVRNIEASTRKTGFRGMTGNKGGVGVRLDVHEMSLCIIGTHLAAGATNVEERNSEFGAIESGLQFMRGKTALGHDHVFWAGDLNYRLDRLTSEQVRAMVGEMGAADSRALETLRSHDQLLHAQRAGLAFAGYKEGPLDFAPTYKYDLDTDVYDSSEKYRAPAWTDRILCKSAEGAGDVDILQYGRVEVRWSDHRPVYVLLGFDAPVVDAHRRAAIHREVLLTTETKFGNALPPPSNAAQQWWNSAHAIVPHRGAPGNPFTRTPALPQRPQPVAIFDAAPQEPASHIPPLANPQRAPAPIPPRLQSAPPLPSRPPL
ncbi:phosphoinositide 5-phosphatase [Malassezia vespertilionis]|uniref:phosphoinositide 5-phosphatase n=1 Tax=Malassezia vespertilionis TaxID=2020962 RepID=UPI0024B048D2|nr:phosphoinositide 5-phosphatase [Malassezia vespertilionis]WFD08063.1 phosphoinositide 5-phosphatase [Malassezia vespertilionis]